MLRARMLLSDREPQPTDKAAAGAVLLLLHMRLRAGIMGQMSEMYGYCDSAVRGRTV